MFKTKTITLEHGWSEPTDPTGKVFNYMVKKVTDSTEFAPRDILNKSQVDELCKSREWKVTIVALGE